VLTSIALQWKERPSYFGVCDPKDDAAMMAAFVMSKGDMEAYKQYIEDIKAKELEDDS
jgi:hypothetical protein